MYGWLLRLYSVNRTTDPYDTVGYYYCFYPIFLNRLIPPKLGIRVLLDAKAEVLRRGVPIATSLLYSLASHLSNIVWGPLCLGYYTHTHPALQQ